MTKKVAAITFALLVIAAIALSQHGGTGPTAGGGPAYDGGAVTSPFLAPDGSVSAPAFSFTSDTDTGLFHEAVNEINFTSNGAEIVEWRYSGTATSYFFLNPANTSNGSGLLSSSSGSSSMNWYFKGHGGITGNAGGFYTSATDAAFFAGNGAATGMLILAGTPTNPYIRFETDYLGTDYLDIKPASAPSGTLTVTVPAATGTVLLGGGTNTITLGTVAFSALGSPANGTLVYCSDCQRGTTPCAGSGSGSMAKREAGAWYCD